MKRITKILVTFFMAVYLPLQLVAQIEPDYNGIIEPTEAERALMAVLLH